LVIDQKYTLRTVYPYTFSPLLFARPTSGWTLSSWKS